MDSVYFDGVLVRRNGVEVRNAKPITVTNCPHVITQQTSSPTPTPLLLPVMNFEKRTRNNALPGRTDEAGEPLPAPGMTFERRGKRR